ncbi:cytochrome c oxidase assembly protein COX16 [Aspergillus niger CBS 101883]|uniref:Cytochrome c oxidase assembly protein COX16, mitochondrial n=2 Tax=Aspergillus niger TaxID=5061 RepID=A2R2B0_ASPNC|nr:uncharacterized protein BO96DRAFT_430810 [Aspergillus niger CBS 101883]XP_059602218.1 uncharacterized protein An14g00110 [Aspergillus niger]PYH60903.1 hypothetical protein BO96DRAFT_430810 [Aspergillus niger CBS 101883]CAK41810.1 unnamed protein product [Aspergillus niger]
MPVFQAKTFRRATTASSTLGERIGAAYRAHLTKRPFLLFGLPFIMIIVAGSFALTPAAALRYERYDRKVKQLSQEEAINLGLKGPDGDEGIKRNPRRRIIGDEREEYYLIQYHCYSGSWPKILMIGSKREYNASKANPMGNSEMRHACFNNNPDMVHYLVVAT